MPAEVLDQTRRAGQGRVHDSHLERVLDPPKQSAGGCSVLRRNGFKPARVQAEPQPKNESQIVIHNK